MTYAFTVPGRAYPHPRVTHRQIQAAVGRNKRGEALSSTETSIIRYLEYREAVSICAMSARIPEIKGPAEFKAVFWFKGKRHGDRTNLVKAAEDGCEHGGIVKNDKQFLRDGGSEIVYGEPERTEITVRAIEEVSA